ncbi:MAG: hypothetical protein O7C59_08215 [Rickettsia endosymbiont of Ixodes persulcatus]|nr:hypothetical protein [Rickettsia endosymbiont of Ixodes persulcatus]
MLFVEAKFLIGEKNQELKFCSSIVATFFVTLHLNDYLSFLSRTMVIIKLKKKKTKG